MAAIDAWADLRASAGLTGPRPATLTASASIAPAKPATLGASAAIRGPAPALLRAGAAVAPPAPALLRAAARLSGEVAPPPAVEAWADLRASARLRGRGVRRVPARAELRASARLSGRGVKRISAWADLRAGARLIGIGESVPRPITGPLTMAVTPTGWGMEVAMSHWKEGDTEPPLRVRVTDSLGPPDLLGHEAEVIVAKGAGHPPILRRVGIVEEGGAIQPGESAGEIVIPWLPSETVPGVYEVMVRVDGQRSAPARGYGVIVIERALG